MPRFPLLLLVLLPALLTGAEDTLVKDVVRLEGAATVSLMGEGLVIGLAGTGDKSDLTRKLAQRLYQAMGSTFDLKDFDTKNMAAVIVTAKLPPFKARGDRIDIEVASTNGASSLRHGRLLWANLTGPGATPEGMEKPVLAVADGSVQVGGEEKAPGGTAAATSGPAGHPTVGRVVDGAQVLDPNPGKGRVVRDGKAGLLLLSPDFANAQRVAQALNAEFGREQTSAPVAKAESANRIEVILPPAYRDYPADFLSRVMELPLTLVKERSRVVVNARTGVVTYSGDVRLSAVQVSFGEKSESSMFIEEGGALRDLLARLDRFATPARKLEVLNNLHRMGALRAELVIE